MGVSDRLSISLPFDLTNAAEDGILMVEILPLNAIPLLGDKITINCTAEVIYDVVYSLRLTLIHPDGTNISSSVGTMLSVVLESTGIADAGEYTCSGEIQFPELNNMSLFAQQKTNVSLNCKWYT